MLVNTHSLSRSVAPLRARRVRAALHMSMVAALVLTARPGLGQERVPLTVGPELDLAIATFREPVSFDIGVSAGGAVGLPEAHANTTRGELAVDVLTALRATRTTHVAAWSRWSLPVVTSFDGTTTALSLSGRHRARAALGVLTTRGARRHGFNLTLDAAVQHQSAQHVGIRDARYGDGAFVGTELEATFAPKFAVGERGPVVLVIPVSYVLHDTTYPHGGTPVPGAPQGHGVRAGVGLQSRVSEWREGIVRFVDVRWQRVGVDRRAPFAGTEHIAFDAYDVRLLDMDGVVFYEDQVFWSVDFSMGMAGFEPVTGGPSGATFAFRLGSRARTPEGGGGFSVARNAVWSADGERALGDTRLELEADYHPDDDAGLRAVLGFSWLDALDSDADLLTFRLASTVELAWPLGGGFEAGVYYAVNRGMDLDDTTWDPWTAAMRWDQQAGAFARWGRALQ